MPEWLDPSWITGLVGFIAGAAVAVFADPLRQWLFRPRVKLRYLEEQTETPSEVHRPFIHRTPEVTVFQDGQRLRKNAIYLRIEVVNEKGSIARECRAFLVSAQIWNGIEKRWEPSVLDDPLPLAWASRGEYRFQPIDLPKQVPHFIDLVSTRDFPDDAPLKMEVEVTPFRLEDFGKGSALYRFKLLVAGDNFDPVPLTVMVDKGAGWDAISSGMSERLVQ
jgi:hypothetical protein